MAKTYVFGIGGTGARVLKSLSLLLASGVECDTSIVPIIIDPDMNNGDLTRTVTILQHYNDIRSQLVLTNNSKNRFFQTEIIETSNFRLPINNSQNVTFKQFMEMDTMSSESRAMMQMLFSENNLTSDMVVGFKGNPNIGSVVLNQFADTDEFQEIANGFTQGDRIFIISSIFGGTGASGFPLLLKTLRTNHTMPNFGLINNAPIGAITVLPYFKVEQDGNSSIDSGTFISKAKAALSYYEKNISQDIDSLYYVGDDSSNQQAYRNNEGGHDQQNNAHIVELLSALAVLDFANSSSIQRGTYKEFGLSTDKVENIIFSDFADGTKRQIRRPMTQMMLFTHYLRECSIESCLGQQWSQTYKLDRNFFDSDFMSNVRFIQDEYVTWLQEMEKNQIGFAPFAWNADKPFDIVKGVTPKKGWLFSKKDYQAFDLALDKVKPSGESENDSQIMMELFYQATANLVHEKLNM
jgi:hypothetical protein